MSVGHSMRRACEILRISRSRRYYQANPRPKKENPIPHRERNIPRIPDSDVQQILDLFDAHPDLSADAIYQKAQDSGLQLASLRTFYRIARAHGKLQRQRRAAESES